MNTDIIYLRELRIDTRIGVLDWEQRLRQTITMDLELGLDIAAVEDDLAATHDYSAIAERLIEFVGSGHFRLLETLAEQCADLLRTEFAVRWLRLRLAKANAVAAAAEAGVVIERGSR